jgi:hypothetical protein
LEIVSIVDGAIGEMVTFFSFLLVLLVAGDGQVAIQRSHRVVDQQDAWNNQRRLE